MVDSTSGGRVVGLNNERETISYVSSKRRGLRQREEFVNLPYKRRVEGRKSRF